MSTELSVETIVTSMGGSGVVVYGLLKFIILDKLEMLKTLKSKVEELEKEAVTDGELTKTVTELKDEMREGFRDLKGAVQSITARIDGVMERRGTTR